VEMKRDSIWTCSSRRSIGCRQQTRYGWQFRLQSEDVTKTPACAASALIGFGLMAAHLKSKSIEVLAEPRPYRPRPDERWRRRLLRRVGDPLRVVHRDNPS
jgi:hypothetical protein